MFVLRLFKMVPNQIERCRSVKKILPWKPCEIYRRMSDVSGEVCFSQKMFTNGLIIDLTRGDWVEKTAHRVERYRLTSKEKVSGAVVRKEGDTDSVRGHERTSHHWFPWKGAILQSVCFCQLHRQNSTHSLNDLRVYIYIYIYIYIYTCVCVCVCVCLPTPPHKQDVTRG